jgi:hypothetical protein
MISMGQPCSFIKNNSDKMKKIKLFSVLALLCSTTFAQYKKASFFNKDGRTLDLGTSFSFIPNGGGKPTLSFIYTASVEANKLLSPYSELELMAKTNFSFVGSSRYGIGSDLKKYNGTGPLYIMSKYGVQYRLIKPETSSETKLVPYIKAGLGFGVGFSSNYTLTDEDGISPSTGSTDPTIPDHELFLVAEPGAGVTYYFSKKIGIKIGGSYMYVKQLAKSDGQTTFFPVQSHLRVNLSFKYRVFSED